MQWKIKDIPDDGLDVRTTLPAELAKDALAPSGADLESSTLAVELQLFRQSQEVLVRGRLHGEVNMPCAGCLQPARIEVEVPVELLFTPPGSTPELDEEDPLSEMDILHHDNLIVDVTVPLRELVIVSLPMAARCTEACRGLCSECGHNLNEGPCKHVETTLKASAAKELLRGEGKLAAQLRALGLAGQKQKN